MRKDGTVPYLRPDGKTQVTIEYVDGRPVRLDTVVVSSQHAADIDLDTLLTPDIAEHVVAPELAELDLDTEGYRLLVNPTGRFEIGGPMGDAGLTGRKIIVDTYGGMARHGGGAFSGKDPSKVDRSAAYAMRWVAKNVVAAGLAEPVRGAGRLRDRQGAAGRPVRRDLRHRARVPDEAIQEAVVEVFDLRPAAIIRDLDLLRPIYPQTAAYGHFGRPEPGLHLGVDRPGRRAARGRRSVARRTRRRSAAAASALWTSRGRAPSGAMSGRLRHDRLGGRPSPRGRSPRSGHVVARCRSRGSPSTSRCRTSTGRSTTPSRPSSTRTAVPGSRVRVRFAGQLVDGFLLERVAIVRPRGPAGAVDGRCRAEPVLTPRGRCAGRAVADR